MMEAPGGTQIWPGYGCQAQIFDHDPIYNLIREDAFATYV